jgi:hypothetical protein
LRQSTSDDSFPFSSISHCERRSRPGSRALLDLKVTRPLVFFVLDLVD